MTDKRFILAEADTHVWLAYDHEIEDESLLTRYESWLSSEERTRWGRFKFAKHRHQFLVTRALVRSALSCYHPQVGEKDWKFTTNQHGRPAVDNVLPRKERVYFNVSHTDGLIALAVARTPEVGIDVETTGRNGELSDIAENYFSSQEVSHLRSLPVQDHRDRFFDLWTLKESYIKARGMGLAIPLSAFTFTFPVDESIQFSVDQAANDFANGWRFWQYRVLPTYKLALASRMNNTPSTIRFLNSIPGAVLKTVEPRCFRTSLDDSCA